MSAQDFTYDGKCYTCYPNSKFLVETANGTSSYTLDRGFGPTPEQALEHYNAVASGGTKKKRLTLITNGKRVVVARHPK
jgi:hypothetical protein